MTEQVQLDGHISRFGKPDSRYWYYFRQGGEEYGVFYENFKIGFKPTNYNYERALQREAAALARSKKRSIRFNLSGYIDSINHEKDFISVDVFLRGSFNQTIPIIVPPSLRCASDMGVVVSTVMEKLEPGLQR